MNENTEIALAAKRCRAAFAKNPTTKWAWCCHHEKFFEELTEPAENRINFILESKAKSEQVCRLNNFRPVTNEKKFKTASRNLMKLYEQDVPMGTWTGKSIIRD